MAIQPIDLQTMYSQVSNVAQNAVRIQESAQLASAINQQNIVQETLQEDSKVREAAREEAETMNVKNDSNSGGAQFSESEKDKNQKKDEKHLKTENVYESYIGQHINITR